MGEFLQKKKKNEGNIFWEMRDETVRVLLMCQLMRFTLFSIKKYLLLRNLASSDDFCVQRFIGSFDADLYGFYRNWKNEESRLCTVEPSSKISN